MTNWYKLCYNTGVDYVRRGEVPRSWSTGAPSVKVSCSSQGGVYVFQATGARVAGREGQEGEAKMAPSYGPLGGRCHLVSPREGNRSSRLGEVHRGAVFRTAARRLRRRRARVRRVPLTVRRTHVRTRRQSGDQVRRVALCALDGMGHGVAALLDGAAGDGVRTGLARLCRHLRRRDRAEPSAQSEAGPVVFSLFLKKQGAGSRA